MAESGLECQMQDDCGVDALNPSAIYLPLPYPDVDDVGLKARDTDEQTEA